MAQWFIFGIAVAGTILISWFCDVHRIMRERKNAVEVAGVQLAACSENALRLRGDPETEAVLERSKRIYRQAVVIYDRTIQKPRNYLPALLMGYSRIS